MFPLVEAQGRKECRAAIASEECLDRLRFEWFGIPAPYRLNIGSITEERTPLVCRERWCARYEL